MMLDSRRRIFFGFLALVWLTVIISLYYVWHKPLTLQIAVPIAKALGQVAVSLGIISLAGGVGRRLSGSRAPGLAEAALHVALGCGVLGLGMLLIGSSLGMNSWYAWIVLLGLGFVLSKNIRAWWQNLREFKQIWVMSQTMGKWLAVGLGVISLMTLLTALAPPLKFDALVYHLALPRFYQITGRIEYTPWLMFWGMPQTGEMLFTWAINLAGVEAAVVLGWLLGVVAISGLVGYLSSRLGALPAWVGAATLTAGFTYSSSLSWA